jgi:hypothetical protein
MRAASGWEITQGEGMADVPPPGRVGEHPSPGRATVLARSGSAVLSAGNEGAPAGAGQAPTGAPVVVRRGQATGRTLNPVMRTAVAVGLLADR